MNASGSTAAVAPRAEAGFRGWYVVWAAFTVLFVVYGIQFSFGTFIVDIVEDTGWPKTRLQLIFAVYVFGYSALSAVSGILTDRLGPRRVIAAGAVILTIGYLTWALAPNLWVAFIGLGVIAPIGMSASWVPCNATVVRWFIDRRGLALAITAAGGSLANIVVPPLAASLVEAVGWRTAVGSLSAFGGLVMLVSSAWFLRDPESVAQLPDGRARVASAPPVAKGLTVGEASRLPTYWLILAMYSLTFLVVFVPFVHVNQFAISLGISPVTAATVISSIGVGGLAGRLTVGPLSDRLGRKPMVMAALAIETLAFVVMGSANGLALLYPSAIAFGFSYGASATMLPALVGDYFGREHAGSIVGRMFALSGALGAVGPYAAQLLVDSSGSYRVSFFLSGAANGAALLLAMRLPRPR